MKFFFPAILLCAALSLSSSAAGQEAVFSGKPLRVGVAGLVHGHVHWNPGPKEIGVSRKFLGRLTDPVLTGGGALIDFGCYGANLIAVVHGAQQVSPLSLSSLVNNLIVVEILEAARKSAEKGKTIDLKP